MMSGPFSFMHKLGITAFIVAVTLYALFSSPSPDQPGGIEVVIITALLVAGFCGGVTIKDIWAWPLIVLLAYGLCVPMLVGVLSGAAAGDILRDIVAFGALGLPILLARLLQTRPKIFLASLIGIGLIFSVRYLMTPNVMMAALASGPFDDRLLYLANSPLVFFASLWLLLQGSFAERKWRRAVVYILVALIPIAAMMGMMQRATLVLLMVAWVAGLGVCFMQRPQRALFMTALAGVLIIMGWPILRDISDSLILKTQMVGWNARGQEWEAIFAQINQSPINVLFGRGWGALMQSPAVADEWVRFSHSLLSSMLWKGGWVGLILTIVAIGALVGTALKRIKVDAVTSGALIIALIPACFLYGSYKSLCFGLLVTGLAVLRLDKGHDPVLTTSSSHDQ